MQWKIAIHLNALLLFWPGTSFSASLLCETTNAAVDPAYRSGENVYVADCIVETTPSFPFVLTPSKQATFTAERKIYLRSGFHAYNGSRFQTKFRDCIRNPEKDTGYASWGSYSDDDFTERVAKRFVSNFDSGPLAVELKYPEWSPALPRFYKDRSLVGLGSGFDDISYPPVGETSEHGIDEGVLFFHVGHGEPEGFDIRYYAETVERLSVASGASEMRIGNCSNDRTENGELRYLWLCSCRTFAHGPAVARNDPRSPEFDRPSDFDGRSTDDEAHRNVIARWEPILSENVRLACGFSTRGTCGGGSDKYKRMDLLWEEYRSDGGKNRNVADAWGHALSGVYKAEHENPDKSIRDIFTTPLCIAMGNMDQNNLRSPLTDDQRFTNKANPYDEAFHVVSWETISEGDTPERIEKLVHRDETITLPDIRRQNLYVASLNSGVDSKLVKKPFLSVAQITGSGTIRHTGTESNMAGKMPPDSLPILLISSSKMKTQEAFTGMLMEADNLQRKGHMFLSMERTQDNRPKMSVDTRTGAKFIAGDRQPISVHARQNLKSYNDYVSTAAKFIQELGWQEKDMYQESVITSILQVIPKKSQKKERRVLKTQKDITFRIGRRIPVGNHSIKIFGRDNMITIQMNNDGSVISASKHWKTIDGKTDNVAVKPYEKAYDEARATLSNTGLYEMSDWDWGYQSVRNTKGQDMLVIYYHFVFEPIAAIDTCISEPIHVEIPGQQF